MCKGDERRRRRLPPCPSCRPPSRPRARACQKLLAASQDAAAHNSRNKGSKCVTWRTITGKPHPAVVATVAALVRARQNNATSRHPAHGEPSFSESAWCTLRGGEAGLPGPVRPGLSDRPYRSSFCDSRAKMAAYTMAMDAGVYGRDFKRKQTLKSSYLAI
jgi:hypothetical protein